MMTRVVPLLVLLGIAAAAAQPRPTTNPGGQTATRSPTVHFDAIHTFPAAVPEQLWASLIQATDGNLYGTSSTGGGQSCNCGTVFRMTTAGSVAVLHAFAGGADGSTPKVALIQATDGNFYGTTERGGASDQGTAFKMTPAGAVTVLHAFAGGADGSTPKAALIQATDGYFYGTTANGGAANQGTVFTMTPAGTLTVLHAFVGGAGGAGPQAALIQATDGNFYGTAADEGTLGTGSVFRITPGGTLTVLHVFTGGAGGSLPYAGLVQATDGKLYGMTYSGGAFGYGTIFTMTLDGTVTALHSFDWATDGANPYAALIQATDGHLYGTSLQGGYLGVGTAFRITLGGTFTMLHAFGAEVPVLSYPTAALMRASDGNFYGTSGGSTGVGAAFKMTASGVTSVLHVFTDNSEGQSPSAPLILATDGNFYGTAADGGASGYGTVFKVTTAGALTLVHTFTGDGDGASPRAALIQATDGNFYGTTSGGGLPASPGTVFKMTPAGVVTVLHTFIGCANGCTPHGALIQAADGDFYGTTATGGDFPCGGAGCGTVFKVTSAGTFTVLHSFDGDDGAFPEAALTRATDGNFYGTTSFGGGTCGFMGATGCGVVFRMTPAGAVTVLHAFSGNPDGILPYSALIQASDGNLYGTTSMGGASANGTAFKITTAGTFTVLHGFAGGTGGAAPHAGLIQAAGGSLYGTTTSTIFRMTPSGAHFVQYAITGVDGSPSVALVQATDGSFYGTTSNGGTAGAGTVFRLRRDAVPFTDGTLSAGSSVIRAVHLAELRTRTDAVRATYGLGAFSYADSTLTAGTTTVRAQHILDLRTAVSQAYVAAGFTAPTFADSSLAGAAVKAVHVSELRTAVVAIE